MTIRSNREIELLDAELWDLPRRLSPADCRDQAGLTRDRDPRNPDGEPLEDDR